MKRFIDIGSQTKESEGKEFAFYDTVRREFEIFNYSQTWETKVDFITDYNCRFHDDDELDRYLSLIPDSWE